MKKTLDHALKLKNLMRLLVFAVVGGLIALSCAQDAIFYNLSLEPVPIEPRIPGSPTNIAVVEYTNTDPPYDPPNPPYIYKKLYVGTRMSKKIYVFSQYGWSSMGTPGGGSLGELASDGTSLYALVFHGGDPLKSSEIYRYEENPDPAWAYIGRGASGGYSIQTLHATEGGGVFAGGQLRGSSSVAYAIFHVDGSDELEEIKPPAPNSLLKGAATLGTNTYLATAGSGIWVYDGSSVSADFPETSGVTMNGIIEVEGRIVAVSSNLSGGGNVYISDAAVTSFSASPNDLAFTGAMGVWRQYDETALAWKPALLLLGVRGQGTTLVHGYRELVLYDDGTNIIPTPGQKSPGERYGTPTSAKNDSRYNATIGKHPVQSILQVPDGLLDYTGAIAADPAWEPLIFASTSRDGLWSYRNGQWNAEE